MMTRIALAAAAGAALLSGCATMDGAQSASASGGPIVGPIREGRCHMGGCSWFQVQSFEMVRENEKGALLRATVREGGSEHPNGDYPQRPRESAIRWTAPDTVYFFCSPRYPAIFSRSASGSGYEGFRLDMTTSYGAIEYVQNQYRAICHPDGDMAAPGSAARLGYTAIEGEPELRLNRPEDVFDRVN